MSMPCGSHQSCSAGYAVTSRNMAGHVGVRAVSQQWPHPARNAQSSSACSVVICKEHKQPMATAHTAVKRVAMNSIHGYQDEMHSTSGEAGMQTKYSRNSPQNSGQRLAAPIACRMSPLRKAPLLLLLLSERCTRPRSVLTCANYQLWSSTRSEARHAALHLPYLHTWIYARE